MEFTELADYAIPAGALVEWLPCATGPWVPDPRPVSYIHEAHLNRSAAGAGDKSWLGTAFEISGPLDVDAFRVALGRWIDRHEVLRSHTVLEPSSGEITRHTVPLGGIDIGVVSHGYDASSQDNFDHLHRLFDDYASPHSWPSYVFATLTPRGGDGPFTVFFAADHSIIDGFSIVLVAHEIAALYREASTGSAANLFPVGSYVDFGAVEREQMADMEAEKAAVEIWRKALGTDGLPQFPLPIGDRGTDSQNGLSTWLLDADQSKAFSSTCAATGGGYFAGLLGGLAAVGREVAGSDRFEVVTPVHTRSAQEWAGALGWFVGLCPVEFAVGSDCSFGDLATRAAESIASVKPAAAVPFDRIGEPPRNPDPTAIRRVLHGRSLRARSRTVARMERQSTSKQGIYARRLHLDQPHTPGTQPRGQVPGQRDGERRGSRLRGRTAPDHRRNRHRTGRRHLRQLLIGSFRNRFLSRSGL